MYYVFFLEPDILGDESLFKLFPRCVCVSVCVRRQERLLFAAAAADGVMTVLLEVEQTSLLHQRRWDWKVVAGMGR